MHSNFLEMQVNFKVTLWFEVNYEAFFIKPFTIYKNLCCISFIVFKLYS